MAVSGCEFVCKNKGCKYENTGFVLTSAWPLGKIDSIINSKKLALNEPFKKELEEMKKKGRKYACITLPDSENIEVCGYRIHMWCDKCPCIWSYDGMVNKSDETDIGKIIEKAIQNANVPENCPTCSTRLRTFSEVIDDKGEGINCMACSTRLKADVWFCNEVGTGEKLNPLIKLPPKESL